MTIEEVGRLQQFLSEVAIVADKYKLRLVNCIEVKTQITDEPIGHTLNTFPGRAEMLADIGVGKLVTITGEHSGIFRRLELVK